MLNKFYGSADFIAYCRGGADAAAVLRRRGGGTDGYKKRSPRRFLRGDRGGGDLLSRFRSTIGAARLNFSVRDGKRWGPRAVAAFVVRSVRPSFWAAVCRGRVTPEDGAIKNTGRSSFQERGRAISTARLCALPRLHLQPIYVVVCDGPGTEILSRGGLRA